MSKQSFSLNHFATHLIAEAKSSVTFSVPFLSVSQDAKRGGTLVSIRSIQSTRGERIVYELHRIIKKMSSQLLPCRPMSQRICSRPSVGRKMMRGNTWGPFLLLKAVTLMVLSAPSVALLAGDNDGQGENILVPGLAHTNSGYDNIGGEDAICWSSTAANGHENETSQVDGGEHDLHDGRSFQWNSPLQPNFVSGHTAMLSKCPGETSMHIEMNHHDDPDFRYANIHEGTAMETHLMRAKQTYSYHIVAHVDVGAIREIYHLADDAFFQSLVCKDVAFRLIFCPVNGNVSDPMYLPTLRDQRSFSYSLLCFRSFLRYSFVPPSSLSLTPVTSPEKYQRGIPMAFI